MFYTMCLNFKKHLTNVFLCGIIKKCRNTAFLVRRNSCNNAIALEDSKVMVLDINPIC